MIENGKFRSTLDNWGSKERTYRYNTVKDISGQVNYKGEIVHFTPKLLNTQQFLIELLVEIRYIY